MFNQFNTVAVADFHHTALQIVAVVAVVAFLFVLHILCAGVFSSLAVAYRRRVVERRLFAVLDDAFAVNLRFGSAA